MKLISSLILPVICLVLQSCSDKNEITVNQVSMNWQYDVPGTKYWEGLPIGTGRFAAMIPGAIDDEVIAFNDETLWTGGPYNPNNPEGPKVLEKIREYAFAHDWKAATDESWYLGTAPPDVEYYRPTEGRPYNLVHPSNPINVQFYQAMARLNLHIGHDLAKTTGYSRSLSMDSALVKVDYQLDGVNYSRRVFAGYPDQVIVIRLTADRKGKISLSSRFTSLQPSAVTRVEGDEVIMEGTTIDRKENQLILPPQIKWQSRVKIIPEGGTLSIEGDRLVLTNADAATLILAGATNWVAWNDVSANEKQRCNDYITNASKLSYKALLKRHLDDYCPLFAACKINLGPDPDPSRTTTQSMDAIRAGADDPAYEARYFHYGRYLLLAAARENTLAFNNHNIWLDDLDGRWNGRWTLNINLQTNYWPVEPTNMPEVNESLVLFVEQLAQAGARTAKELFGCRGWCSNLGVDVWFNTAPTDGHPRHAVFPLSGAWLMQQLYDHYLYNPDTTYLKRIYPLMKGSVEFCRDFLVKDPVSGYMVTCPSTSPENEFYDDAGNRVAVSYGSAIDIQLTRRLLRDFIEIAETLNTDTELKNWSAATLKQLPPHQIGSFGQLQEWFFDFKEAELTHRHLCPLWAAHPDDDITIRKTPELAEAVKVVLKRRGEKDNRGMFASWRINQYARLEDPETAYEILHKIQADIGIHPEKEDSEVTPSFEGSQGIQAITSGIAEMLLQSLSGEVSLLPALPKQWSNGEASGFRAKGGFDVDMAWKSGALTKAIVKSNHAKPCRLRTKTPVKVLSSGKEISVKMLESNLVEFETKKGASYTILPR